MLLALLCSGCSVSECYFQSQKCLLPGCYLKPSAFCILLQPKLCQCLWVAEDSAVCMDRILPVTLCVLTPSLTFRTKLTQQQDMNLAERDLCAKQDMMRLSGRVRGWSYLHPCNAGLSHLQTLIELHQSCIALLQIPAAVLVLYRAML